jgi:hypothetical protein
MGHKEVHHHKGLSLFRRNVAPTGEELVRTIIAQ